MNASSEVTKFYSGVCQFHRRAAEYIKATFPLNDGVLRHAKFLDAQFLDVEKKEEVTFDSVEYFVHHFPHLHALRTPPGT